MGMRLHPDEHRGRVVESGNAVTMSTRSYDAGRTRHEISQADLADHERQAKA